METATHIFLNGKKYSKENLEDIPWENIRDFLKEWWNDSESIEVQTSGSTGAPKRIVLQKIHMRNSAQMTNSFFGLGSETHALHCLPAQFIAGKMMLVRAMEGQWKTMVVSPDSNPLQHLKSTISFDFAAMIPMQVSNALSEPELRVRFLAIKNVIIGGGEVSNTLLQQLQGCSNTCYATYGMTETITHIALRKLNGQDKTEEYTVMKGIRVNQDARSCLTIHAPTLGAENLITNDLVEFTDFKKFKWLGRADNIINSGGLKIIPEQLEKTIAQLITDRRFYIASEPDELFGNLLTLVIEGIPYDNTTANLLLKHLKEILPKNQSPKKLVFKEKFELTETGKIKRF
jgi:O-succinylbenzoic acid--CoA ligase